MEVETIATPELEDSDERHRRLRAELKEYRAKRPKPWYLNKDTRNGSNK